MQWHWTLTMMISNSAFLISLFPNLNIIPVHNRKRTVMITQRIDVFHRRCLRTILCISNEEVMRRACMERLQDIVTMRRRKVADHFLRLQREIPAHTPMYWVPEDGRRMRRRPKNTCQCTFRENLEEIGVSWHGARRIAIDRESWRLLVAGCSERNRRT